MLAAVVLRAAEGRERRGRTNGNGGIELREGKGRVVEIRPLDRGSFDIVGASDAAIIPEKHPDASVG